MYDDLVDLIKRKRVAFPPFGNGVSKAAVDAARMVLGDLPPSYIWWLENYGGGQIGGDIVYGLDEAGYGAPDIVQLHKTDLAEGVTRPYELVFYIGNGESFYFDTRQVLESGEYPIFYREAGQPDAEYAQSFDSFLQKRIFEVLGR